jgi:hypothetical protein
MANQDTGVANQGERTSPPALEALYGACVVAATQGDCDEVRRLASQLKQRDLGAGSRLATDAGVARCLVE